MNKLPYNFEMDKYGLHVRLVNEDDAEFIIKLRTDEKLGKFIHSTDNDIEKQKEWIRNYKIREGEGSEYYLIYYRDDYKIGLNRIYRINWDKKIYTGGSWLCVPGSTTNDVVATALIQQTIAFDLLKMDLCDLFDGVHIDNKKVLKFNQMMGAKITGTIEDVKGTYYTLTITKEDFLYHCKKLERLLYL